MPIQAVVLWTDTLVFLLVAAAIVFGFWVSRYEHLRAPWREVAERRTAMAALVLLLTFSLVGVLDSIHFKVLKTNGSNGQHYYSGQVYSVLDAMLQPLGDQYERTYSKPFALNSYSKTTIASPDGDLRVYPKLQYTGTHLDGRSKSLDIAWTVLKSAVLAFVIWLVLLIVVRLFIQKNSKTAWREIALTTLFIFLTVAVTYMLSRNYHIFGTDKVGKDVFFEAVKSIRTGLVIGTITTIVMLPFAIFLGAVAGYFRGWVDDLIQYIYTTLSSVPGVLLISAAVLALQVYISNHAEFFPSLEARADARLLALCFILGVTSWTSLCRLIRAETLKLREMDFVRASFAMGVRNLRIITRHVVPNIMHIVLITVVLDFSALVLAEAVLSYVGVGVDPTTLSWGNMINSSRLDLAREPLVWWPLLAAFIFMFALVLSANLFADAVRDAFDPRLRDAE